MKKSRWMKILSVLLLMSLIAGVAIIWKSAQSRPCLAIPTRFVLEYPECARRLVEAANVSGVRIVSVAASKRERSDEQEPVQDHYALHFKRCP